MTGRPFGASFDEATSTLVLSGIIDELSLAELQAAVDTAVEAAAAGPGPLAIDLSDVDFLPSVGLGVLAVAIRTAHAAGDELVITTRSGTLAQRVLEISGLPFVLNAAG